MCIICIYIYTHEIYIYIWIIYITVRRRGFWTTPIYIYSSMYVYKRFKKINNNNNNKLYILMSRRLEGIIPIKSGLCPSFRCKHLKHLQRPWEDSETLEICWRNPKEITYFCICLSHWEMKWFPMGIIFGLFGKIHLVTGKIHNLSVRSWLSLQKTPISLSGHQLLWGNHYFDHQFWWKKSLQRADKYQIGSVKWHWSFVLGGY